MRTGVIADLRLRVHGVGDDPGLRARERDGLVAEVVHRHRDERARDPLSRREQHVQLARVRLRRDLARELEQPVRGVAHRGDGRDDANAALACLHEPLRDVPDPIRVRDGRAAELHDDGLDGWFSRCGHKEIVARPPLGRVSATACGSGGPDASVGATSETDYLSRLWLLPPAHVP